MPDNIHNIQVQTKDEKFKQHYLIPLCFDFGLFPVLYHIPEEDFNWVSPPREVITSNKYFIDCLVGTAVYLFASTIGLYFICVVFGSWAVIALDPNSNKWIYDLRFRLSPIWSSADSFSAESLYNSHHISLGPFFYFMFQILAGFTFVNLVTL
jgi:hypothetical protein